MQEIPENAPTVANWSVLSLSDHQNESTKMMILASARPLQVAGLNQLYLGITK